MWRLYKKSCLHLYAVNESYLKHFCFAMKFFLKLFAASCVVIVHAFIPAFFERTGSNMVKRLHAELQERVKDNV